VLLGQLLEPRGEVDRVADGGELLAARRADIAGDRRADMQPDPDAQRPRPVGQAAAVDLADDLARRRDGVARRAGIVERRTEDGR